MRITSGCTTLWMLWLGTVAFHASAADWSDEFVQAEAFLPPGVSKALPLDVSAPALDVRWAADESWFEWTVPGGKPQRVMLPAGKAAVVDASRDDTNLQVSPPAGRVLSKDGRFSVYAESHNLYVTDAAGTRALTTDGELWRTFDRRYAESNPQERPVRSEAAPLVQFLGDTPWLVAERWDFRKVSALWLADSTATPRPAAIEQRRAFPGERDIPRPELWLINVASGAQRLIDSAGWAYVGNMDVGAGGIFPSPDGRAVYFVRMQRQYEILELCRVVVPNGEVEVIWREQRDSYFTVRAPEIAFVGRDEQLIWKSDRDGRTHYYLLDASRKKLIRQLTSGDISVSRVLRVDASNREFWFEAYGDGANGDPNYLHAFRASLDGGTPSRITAEPASHSLVASASGRYFIDTFSTVAMAPRSVLRDRSGRILKDLATADTTQLSAAGWRAPERYRIKAADRSTDLYGVLWKPFDFDAQRRYPVVAVVYPGPGHDAVPTRFAPAHVNAALAQLGFIVIAPGTRGSASWRGVAYQGYARTLGNVRDYTLADLRHSIESLGLSRPWMDTGRVGVAGHSGGGFMALAALLHDPDFYRVGVASAGNHDNNIYEMNSGEFYWGDPRSGPAGGSRGYATNMDDVARLKAALLLIHGETDSDVPVANTLRVIDALIHANKQFDMLILPGQNHEFRYADASANAYARRRTWHYLAEHLLRAEWPPNVSARPGE